MTSRSLFDRFPSLNGRSPTLPFHSPPNRLPSEYDLDELEPRPDHALLSSASSRERERLRSSESPRGRSQQWSDRASSVGSASKYKPRPGILFSGPPPPIAASIMMEQEPARDHGRRNGDHDGLLRSSRAKVSSLLWQHDQPNEDALHTADSVWRGIHRQEKALEAHVQQLLDLQAAGLVAGLGGRPPSGADLDDHSDAGSSTPTGTFYSTATSKSRMLNSLQIPTRANPDGSVVPVRQPQRKRPLGLRGTRTALRKTMLKMAELKSEEAAHIDRAIATRKHALQHLEQLDARREDVRAQLSTLEDDDQEPLGQQLRGLSREHDALAQEIHQMEQRLVALRNRKKMLREKIEDVKNRREAGLSGYRGALRDVDEEVSSIMRHPPVQPLDREIMSKAAGETELSEMSSGDDFMRMIPSRRTLDMARSWWQTEIAVLTRCQSQISSELEALEEGGSIWSEAMSLVTDFEKRLRQAMKGHSEGAASASNEGKGKESTASSEDILREQLPRMSDGIQALEGFMGTAESKNWNLLICAIGAELEAFREAHSLLRGALGGGMEAAGREPDGNDSHRDKPPVERQDESDDNEVPPDLISSAIHNPVYSPELPVSSPGRSESRSSENGVPPEFLFEEKRDKED